MDAESKKKVLAQRLYLPSQPLQASRLSHVASERSLQKTSSRTLVPRLKRLSPMPSYPGLPGTHPIDLASSTARVSYPLFSGRTVDFSALKQQSSLLESGLGSERSDALRRTDLQKSKAVPRQRQHGESIEVPGARTKPTPYDYIQVIKNDPSLAEDFWYFNRSKSDKGFYDAYDFELVSFEEKDKEEYLTISTRGVTHFLHNEAVFLTLQEWEREYTLYKKLLNINFFHKYKKWKHFALWKKLRRRNMMVDREQFLKRELFILDDNLRNCLLTVRTLSFKVTTWKIVSLQFDKICTISEFDEDQGRQRERTAAQLSQLEDSIKQLVGKACSDSMSQFIQEKRTNVDEDADVESKRGEPFLIGDASRKKMTYTQEAITRQHHKRLVKFIRLCDYQIVDWKFNLSIQSTEDVLVAIVHDYTKKENKAGGYRQQNQPLFKIYCSIKEMLLNFEPEAEEVERQVGESIIKGISVVCNNKLLITVPEFQEYTKDFDAFGSKSPEEEFNLLHMVINDEHFKHLNEGIREGILRSHKTMFDKAQTHRELVQTLSDNLKMDVEMLRDYDFEQFKNELVKYKAQIKTFTEMKREENYGLFQLDVEALREKLKPTPKVCLDKIEKLIPRLSYEKASDMLEELKEANAKLAIPPSDVGKYTEFSKNFRELSEKITEFEGKFTEIRDLNRLMEENGIKFNEATKQKTSETQEALKIQRQRLLAAGERAESDKIRFARELREKVASVEKRRKELAARLSDEMFSDRDANPEKVVQALNEVEADVIGLHSDTQKFMSYQEQLEIEKSAFIEVDDMKADFKILKDMWTALLEWGPKETQWLTTPFNLIDVGNISKEVENYYKVSKRSAKLEDKGNFVPETLRTKVEALRNTMPVVLNLRDKTLKPRHWEEIRAKLEHNIDITDPTFTLSSLIELKVNNKKDQIADIALKANKEEELEVQMRDIEEMWKNQDFTVKLHPDSPQINIHILTELDDIVTQLEDTLVNITNIRSSRFITPLTDMADRIYQKFALFQKTLDLWMAVQKQYNYLAPIFQNEEIAKQVKDSKNFKTVDEKFKEMMKDVFLKPRALEACTLVRYKLLDDWNTKMEIVQKKLDDFVEGKRKLYPRFYFLSNDELLNLVASTSNKTLQPKKIVESSNLYLRKVFENVYTLDLNESNGEVQKILSAEGEELKVFSKGVRVRGGPVEEWFEHLENEGMKDAVRRHIKQALNDYEETGRGNWVNESVAQAVSVVDNIMWTTGTEEVLLNKSGTESMSEWYDTIVSQLEELTHVVRGDLTAIIRRSVVALVTQDVHNRDMVEMLRDEEVASISDFRWQKQLRFYTEDNEIMVRQVNANFKYALEYLGATTRLVITPLTDRCWLTITSALHIKMGAAPAGPAGTGKTESTKDLAKALGQYCFVFNCSEQVTSKMMEKLFIGLCYTGTWACLDEFNRIDIEVLSVIAQQLRSIRQAKLENKVEFLFEDKSVKLDQSMGVFITMNPGYAGRTELPDNLKVLVRPVSMMVPDYTLIAQIMLFAEGFKEAKNLSGKMTKLYKLCSEQLSKQDHYDFGMRAVKSVLNMAGALKRKDPELPEEVVLIRAMRDSNAPKFLKEDLTLFQAIITDLFPGVEVPFVDYGELEKAIREVVESNQLQLVTTFIDKIIQLYETFAVRFGVMIVGPAGSGKSACFTMLAQAMSLIHKKRGARMEEFQQVEYTVLNPKSINMNELFGAYNAVTSEWKDGLASIIMREYSGREDKNKRWVVFDGPVDALWIENMNTVLDDNQMLCLANSERIKLKNEMRMLFEVQDLAVASPATVSRCGMVYMTSEAVGWKPYAYTWVEKTLKDWDEQKRAYMKLLFDLNIENGLKFIRKGSFEPIATSDINLVISCCNVLEALTDSDSCPRLRDEFDQFKKYLDKIFVFTYTWCLGGALDARSAYNFEIFMTNQFNCDLPKGSLYDSCVAPERPGGDYKPWDKLKPDYVYDNTMSFYDIVVPTKDTTRFSYILKLEALHQKKVFLTGGTGVGKSIIITDTVNHLMREHNIHQINLAFSARTSSLQTQNAIVSKLESKRRNFLGGPGTKKVVIVIDDINMPEKEKFGAQPPIELIRQLCDQSMFYDRATNAPMKVSDTTLICCAAPPGGGRYPLTPRFTRHFHMLCMPPTAEESLILIFKTILDGFFKPFKNDIQSLSSFLVTATTQVYERISKEMLPTPTRSHYTFNLRDVSKVFQGILMADSRRITNPDSMIRLWIHEACRVFHDRLVSKEDRRWFTEAQTKILLQVFKKDWSHEEVFERKPLFFCDFMNGNLESEDRPYEEGEPGRLGELVTRYLDQYNMDSVVQLQLVFFQDALAHLTRICRILRQQRGNAMLVGVGGSGKQSLTRLAAYISKSSIFQLQLSKDADVKSFKENIKQLLLKAGGPDANSTVFMLTDAQIVHESFLEDVNGILNTGEVNNLFEKEDLDALEQDLRPVAEKSRFVGSMYSFFVTRVRTNLHVVLCMSPVGDLLRIRMRMFPSLVNCCTIDWVDPWPRDALLSVSASKLQELNLEMSKEEAKAAKDALAVMCAEVHTSVEEISDEFFQVLRRKVYTTPKSYLDMIACYKKLLEEKRTLINSSRSRYMKGVGQLRKTNAEVEKMQQDLIKLQPILEVKKQEAQQLMVKVAADTEEANKVKEVVEMEERKVNEQAIEVDALRVDAQAALDIAMPAVYAAEQALKSLNPADITEIRNFPKPPTAVVFTIECVAMLLGDKEDWATIKGKTLVANFFERLTNFAKDNIPHRTLTKLRAKIASNPNFTPEEVATSSRASKSLCLWVYAIEKYATVSKDVAPKRQKVEEMNKIVEEANEKLRITRARLQVELDKLAVLQDQLQQAQDEVERLDNECNTTKARLERASVLTVSLKDENERWQQSVEKLAEQMQFLLGDVFLAASSISYFGPFTSIYRKKLNAIWLEKASQLQIPVNPDFDLQSILGDPMVIRDWNLKELPSDDVSICNAIIVTRCERYPLMIDPQGQANKWIKNMEKKSDRDRRELRISKQTDKDFAKVLDLSIRNGLPLLVEDMSENIASSLDPILQKVLIEKGVGRFVLRVGDKELDFDPGFRLYLTSKMTNPHYLPEIFIKTTIINFIVTSQGLEEQLLVDVVNKEDPSIEQEKVQTMTAMANYQRKMKDLEDQILQSISETKGNILDEIELIKQLKISKETSASVKLRIQEAEDNKLKIEQKREEYFSIAERGSILYFVIADLALVDPMYQYSLTYFKRLFSTIIENSPKADTKEARLEILLQCITEGVFFNVCRGLFNAHKLIFSFLLVSQILKKRGELMDDEWKLLLKGVTMIPADFVRDPCPDSVLFPEKAWDMVIYLQNISAPFKLPRLGADVKRNLDAWSAWVRHDEPQSTEPPMANLSPIHKLLLLKTFREEKVIYGVIEVVQFYLGQKYVQVPPSTMEEVYADSSNRTPIIFILSQGADPTSTMQNFAKDKKFDERLAVISLGQGQGPRAVAAIEAATKTGNWVMLQNCHLAKSWMADLERQVESFAENKGLADEFRLFLTSMPADYFPIPVLQNGIKITNEPPKGIRSNVTRSMNSLSDEILETCSKPREWKQLLVSVCFFHAIIQERRKFGPLGWNIKYEFNESDLETSRTMLWNFLNEGTVIPWDAMRFITGEINYGGRVTDDWDRRCLLSILDTFLGPEVLRDQYQFSDSGVYYIPLETNLQGYKAYAASLPLTDQPEIFGMHDNANIAFQRQESSLILTTALSIQPRDTGKSSTGKTPDQMVDEFAGTIIEHLPVILMKSEAASSIFEPGANGLMDSLVTFLGQEMVRFNRLLGEMKRTLEDLRKAIKGLAVMSGDLDQMYRSLLNNQVPRIWEDVAYPSLKPLGSWVQDMTKRVAFLREWLSLGKPISYWMSSFFFPQGFLTAVLQSYARKYQMPIDTLSFQYEFQTFFDVKSIEETQEDGCYIHGLFMEGARWDPEANQLEDANAGEMYANAPIILFTPAQNFQPDPEEYSMPVYKTTTRAGVLDTTGHSTNFVVSIECASSRKPSYWVLKGAAFLCQLND